jgi:UTP--glucose-1-phosphate uridylyltransferase
MKIRKAVFPAAGLGTRFLPATKAQPKEMLPLVDKPIIQFGVEEAVAAGIEEIIIVTGRGKRSMEDHFDNAPELEQALEKKGDQETVTELRRISEMATVLYVRQREPLGLGHAVLCALPIVGNEPFAVILSDDVIFSETPAIKQLIDVYEKTGSSVVAVEQVAPEHISSYGVVDPKPAGSRLYEVERLVEKPKPQDAPSSLGIVGRYILTPEIFKNLQAIPRGKLGEIQLTDGLQMLRTQQKIYAYEFEGKRYDAGSKLGYLKATVDYALERPDLAREFRDYLSQVCKTE